MGGYLLSRSVQTVLTLLVMSVLVFAGLYLVGNPVDVLLSPTATPAERLQVIQSFGLDKPVWEQYWLFLTRALSGDLGNSFVYNQPALTLILHRMPATLELAFVALVMALVIGIPLGVYAGLKPKGLISKSIMTFSILGFSLPTFWQGMMLVMIFSVWLGWLPSSGRGPTGQILGIETSFASWEGIRHLILPATNLALFKLSLVIRLTRTGVRETMPLDFVKFARAKGLTERRVVLVHVLKTIMIPLVTVIGMEIGSLIAFGVVTETIFAWPGVGQLLIDSIMRLDRPVVVAYLLVVVSLFIVLNFAVDVLYSILDPRIRLGRN